MDGDQAETTGGPGTRSRNRAEGRAKGGSKGGNTQTRRARANANAATSKPSTEATAPEQTGEKGSGPRNNLAPIVGVIAGMMMESPNHRHLFLADLEWLVVPALLHGQYRLFRKDGVPVAYVSWARLTEEAETRMKAGQFRLRPDEWTAGKRLWLIDMIAPFGGAEEILGELKDKVFEGETLKMMQPAPDGNGMAVVEW